MNLIRSSFSVSMILLCTALAYSQGRPDRSIDQRLPNPKEFVNCGLAGRYIDDALAKANVYKSNVIFVVKMKNSSDINLARIRARNVRNYLRFRGFENFEMAVDPIVTKDNRIDIHVGGELLYSLPFKKGDKLKFAECC